MKESWEDIKACEILPGEYIVDGEEVKLCAGIAVPQYPHISKGFAEFLSQFDFMFYLDLTKLKEDWGAYYTNTGKVPFDCPERALAHFAHYCLPVKIRSIITGDELFQILYPSLLCDPKTFYLLDGFSDLDMKPKEESESIAKIILYQILFKESHIVASRPYAMDKLPMDRFGKSVLEIKGISEPNSHHLYSTTGFDII